MPGPREDDGYDEQDGAEAFDEATLDDHEEINEMRTFEELPELFDATRADGDRDDDEALALDADEFDEEAFDDALEEDDELHYRAAASDEDDEDRDEFDDDLVEPDSIEGLNEVADADLVSGGEDDFTNFQAKAVSDEDLERMGYASAPSQQEKDKKAEKALEIGLEDTFPASDPVSATRPGRR
ncbi:MULTISPECIES: hypothetical protein [Phenylobacterium]|uniref:SPOR domain-containing protein n=1 Tax=Phenylobacterium koreense TaxID=266125 RepID=A0ABV2ECZ9_9CAUL